MDQYASAFDDLPVKTVFEYHKEYKVLRQIANGAFGSVHCVQKRDTKVIHAAKYVKSRNSDLEREVNALKSLCKSNLVLKFVALYQNTTGIQSILVTEFLAGGDLCERTSSKDYILTEQKCRNVIRQICRGVQYIHSNNFIHLDLKPFNIVFSQKKDDYDLRIIDFGLAREIDETRRVRIGMCGTIEYMSPEVMNCLEASPASDCWGIGVIAFQLLSGGVSPFFVGNRFRTMARVLDCDYAINGPELAKTSDEAKDFISRLLLKEPSHRMTAHHCLQHPWLVDDKLYLGILETLETTWMRRCLARRRWYRLLNAVRAMTSIRQLSGSWENNSSMSSVSSEDDDPVVLTTPVNRLPNGLSIFDISAYNNTFDKLHLIVNNGAFGTLFCIQHTVSGEVYSSKHLRDSFPTMRKEASILHQLRNEDAIIAFHGLYEGPHESVIVTDFLVGGDLVERTASPDFVLNESKCKTYVRQICQGLQYIHKCNIVHLDLKPFSICFVSHDETALLKITDFQLAQNLPLPERKIKVTEMCGSLEFMSPEVIECTNASTATDCWGVGVISYMLITGGQSPFYGGNRFRTMAKILTAQYSLDMPDLRHISPEAKEFIRQLLHVDPFFRMTAQDCLDHAWLTSDSDYVDVLYTLETKWMKQLLARRRWQRWYNAVRAMQRMRKFSAASFKLAMEAGN
ncbi:hypothetical protein TCAL_03224 [Tigriopus californicus]|uniref:Protein kinase domain-containing protein n=1 Tax=Tigriopus californicus TaxID=6832 RepID=A0A553NT52_TIGCA|nr:calcium/calmodulin-dependent protein kinase type II subunit alpha-like [Tigriopus californicus]TRY68611.1 hypothetical protein TCAL_03224 [Tigriopus californicus]|eukprot:TCALIF_03224-PA protein Name:"Similar to RPS6KA Ribosomal protein S6 kinase 2 alpha (Gallus gallus)" AED:0.04 eAED:0.04 QI:0/-1/0/1/-1/1/1/0/683